MIFSYPRGRALKDERPVKAFSMIRKRSIVKRSIVINGHKTSISLEDAFFSALKDISRQRRLTLTVIITEVDRTRTEGNLSSALRLFVLDFYRSTPPQVLEVPARDRPPQ